MKTLIRTVHNRENPFVQLNKQVIWDSNLSLKAIGLWAKCMSRPDNWTFSIKELASSSKEGRCAIDSAMKELIKCGYACRFEYSQKNEHGRFSGGGVEYVFFEFKATDEEIQQQEEVFKKSFRNCGFGDCGFRDSENRALLIKSITKNEINKKRKPSLKVSESRPSPECKDKEKELAPARESEVFSSDPPKKKRKRKVKQPIEYSDQVKQVTAKMLDLLKRHNPVYRPPQSLDDFMKSVKEMVEDDGQDVKTVLETFEWALSDSHERDGFKGWCSVVSTNKKGRKVTTPAEIFRSHFDKIYPQMKSRPKRKFLPSSDQSVAMAAMEEMDSRAL